eukprot:298760-Pleurochrysis_carterae.AAC.1
MRVCGPPECTLPECLLAFAAAFATAGEMAGQEGSVRFALRQLAQLPGQPGAKWPTRSSSSRHRRRPRLGRGSSPPIEPSLARSVGLVWSVHVTAAAAFDAGRQSADAGAVVPAHAHDAAALGREVPRTCPHQPRRGV